MQAYKALEHTVTSSSRAFPEERERLQKIIAGLDAGTLTDVEAVRLLEAFIDRLERYT